MTNFLHDPVLPAAPDLSTVAPSLLAGAPDRLLALAADLLTWGDTARGGEYLDLLERAQPAALPDPELVTRSAVMRSFHYGVTGQLDEAVSLALAARASQGRTPLTDDWNITVPLILLRLYNCLEDYEAVEREAVAALAMPSLTEVARLVLVPGARALAWQERGNLADAADAARAAHADATAAGIRPPFLRRGSPARAGRPRAGASRPRYRGTARRAGAVDNGAAAAPVRVPHAARPGRDLGGPRAGPRGAGQRRGGAPRAARGHAGAAGAGR